MALASLCNFRDVKDLESWVSWCLHPDNLSVGLKMLFKLRNDVEIDKGHFDVSVRAEDSAQISCSAAVYIIDTQDMITSLAEIHNSHIRRHAGVRSEGEVSLL